MEFFNKFFYNFIDYYYIDFPEKCILITHDQKKMYIVPSLLIRYCAFCEETILCILDILLYTSPLLSLHFFSFSSLLFRDAKLFISSRCELWKYHTNIKYISYSPTIIRQNLFPKLFRRILDTSSFKTTGLIRTTYQNQIAINGTFHIRARYSQCHRRRPLNLIGDFLRAAVFMARVNKRKKREREIGPYLSSTLQRYSVFHKL